MSTVRKIRWFWSWNDLEEEKWLRDMSAQGLHLKDVENPCFYIFEQGEPTNYVYKLDYHLNNAMFNNLGWFALAKESKAVKENRKEYHQLFRDAGWKYLGTSKGWKYFRQAEETGKVQELYTDQASKEKKYRRQIIFQILLIILVSVYTVPTLLYDDVGSTLVYFILALFVLPLLPLGLRWRKLRT
ncbi:MAG: DUF2812 domain-containing protein [Chloroflexota bacterium]